MPSRTQRKIFEIGGKGRKSKAMVLPKEWAEGTSIEKGDAVEVWYNGILFVIPKGYPEPSRTRVLTLLQEGRI
jgi:antitoxin component of MazEF toxin-antitoxin module